MSQPTEFINIWVVAIPQRDETGKVTYETTFTPDIVKVTSRDTVINYQIVDPTPAGVQFSSVTIKPDHENQFSDPSISRSKKMVTFSDANTIGVKFNLTFNFSDKDGIEFMVDPEIENWPPPDVEDKNGNA